VARLEKVFATIDKKPQGKTCDAIFGITDEGAEIMKTRPVGIWFKFRRT
jgi:ferritin-like metal-binding protein YciE